MTRLARRATLLVALYLLASAATAHAECAWVLWMMGESSPWHVFQAFSTREGCITAMHQQVESHHAHREDSDHTKDAQGQGDLRTGHFTSPSTRAGPRYRGDTPRGVSDREHLP